jgi:hypothetical protein
LKGFIPPWLAPATVTVTTFHVLGDQRLRAEGHSADFRQACAFE